MTGPPLLLGVDEGTSGVKAVLYDLDLRPVAEARRAKRTVHPRPGWVEQDPEEVLAAVVEAVAELLADAPGEVVACGLDHQGESVLAWDAESGRALSPVVVWQDKRQTELLERMAGDEGEIRRRSGLPLDPYFSSGKLAWLLEHAEAVGRAAEAGTLRLGTVDAFLCDRLGAGFATDLSTASRTQLAAPGAPEWDPWLCERFGVPRAALPALEDTAGELGVLRHESWPVELPLTARLVDQQAALAGAGCVEPGRVKATYGTGVFVLAHVGTDRPATQGSDPSAPDPQGSDPSVPDPSVPDPQGSDPSVPDPQGSDPSVRGDAGGRPLGGLLPTVAWRIGGRVEYALDGGVFTAGALLDFLAGDLGLAGDAAGLAELAGSVPDAGGVRVLPALSGLGAPWWRPGARAVVAGLTGGSTTAHVARAALEAIAWRVADIVEEVGRHSPLDRLRVDGGLTRSALLRQLQADTTGLPVETGLVDATAAGAAALAAVGAGRWSGTEEIAARIPAGERTEPRAGADAAWRAREHAAWREFVRRAAEL